MHRFLLLFVLKFFSLKSLLSRRRHRRRRRDIEEVCKLAGTHALTF